MKLPSFSTFLPASRGQRALILFMALISVSGVTWISAQHAHDVRLANAMRQAGIAQAQKLKQEQTLSAKQQDALKQQTAPASQSTTQPTPAVPAQPAPKYSTSSDPRSTAHTTTPPVNHPASFDIPITHSGQVAAGTAISYNATKNEKTYYGGDLQLSPSIVNVYSDGQPNNLNVTVSTPDGATVNMPSVPWNSHTPGIGISMDAATYKAIGSSFNMVVDPYAATPGTYTLHITTTRNAQTTDAWQYDGFITVIVH